MAELVGAGTACKLEAAGMEPRFGSAAAFVDGKVGTFLFFNTTFSILPVRAHTYYRAHSFLLSRP